MPRTKELEKLVEKYATRYNIIPDWMSAIITQESAWDVLALRHEPNYSWLYEVDQCAKINRVTAATETVMQKTSFGLAQLMGALAREQGLKGSIAQLLDAETNLNHMGMRIKYLKKISSNKDDIFAMYNGGPGAYKRTFSGLYTNQSYVDKINEHLKNKT